MEKLEEDKVQYLLDRLFPLSYIQGTYYNEVYFFI